MIMATKKKWVQDVKTVSTYPPKDIFTKDAETIAKSLGSTKVSPKGIGSGIRMIQYFINRGGKGLSALRKKELEKAKRILQSELKGESKHAADRNRGSAKE
jgi:hypothetical protein